MPFCPQCEAEYTAEITTCTDCQVELVPQLPPDDSVEYIDWEAVREVPSEFVGNMIKGVLEEEGIDAVVRAYEIGALGGVRLEPEWGEVFVHRDDLRNAEKIVAEYLDTLPANTLEDEDAPIEDV